MLKYKARAFNLRDNFPDVLFGMHLTEEMYGEEPLPAPESDVKPRGERRMAVPSTTVDTTRAPVKEAEPSPVDYAGEERRKKVEACLSKDPTYRPNEPKLLAEDAPEPAPELVTFVCKECGQTYQYGKEAGKGVPCECGKGLLVEVEKQLEPAEPAGDEDKKPEEAKTLYMEVNGMYVVQGGKDFFEFAAYVLLLDESEVSPSKLTEEQLKQIKAYIETSGVEIS